MNVTEKHNYVLIEFPKPVDRQTYTLAQNAFQSLLKKGCKLFVLDLQAMDHIYSLEISIVIRLYKMVQEQKAELCLVNVGTDVLKVLESVQVDKTVCCYKSLDEFEAAKLPRKDKN